MIFSSVNRPGCPHAHLSSPVDNCSFFYFLFYFYLKRGLNIFYIRPFILPLASSLNPSPINFLSSHLTLLPFNCTFYQDILFTIILVSLSPAVCIYSFSAEQLTGFLAIIGAVCLPISFTVVTVSFLPDLIFFESVKSCYLISSLPFLVSAFSISKTIEIDLHIKP